MDHATHKFENMNHEEKLIDYIQFGFIIFIVVLISVVSTKLFTTSNIEDYMRMFMGWFFLIFGGFKIVNLKEFVTAYRRYDFLAKRSKIYSFVYPILEITLGILFLTSILRTPVLLFTSVLMSVSLIGVVQTLVTKDTIMCACLGGIIKLPVTKITLTEDLVMLLMSVAMLLM